MWAMILKEFRELRRDPRTLAMLIVLPVLFLTVFGFAANFTITRLSTAVVGPQAAAAARQLEAAHDASRHLEVVITDPAGDAEDARDLLRDGRANIAVVTGGAKPVVYIDGSSLFAAQSASVVVARLGTVDTTHCGAVRTRYVPLGPVGCILLLPSSCRRAQSASCRKTPK